MLSRGQQKIIDRINKAANYTEMLGTNPSSSQDQKRQRYQLITSLINPSKVESQDKDACEKAIQKLSQTHEAAEKEAEITDTLEKVNTILKTITNIIKNYQEKIQENNTETQDIKDTKIQNFKKALINNLCVSPFPEILNLCEKNLESPNPSLRDAINLVKEKMFSERNRFAKNTSQNQAEISLKENIMENLTEIENFLGDCNDFNTHQIHPQNVTIFLDESAFLDETESQLSSFEKNAFFAIVILGSTLIIGCTTFLGTIVGMKAGISLTNRYIEKYRTDAKKTTLNNEVVQKVLKTLALINKLKINYQISRKNGARKKALALADKMLNIFNQSLDGFNFPEKKTRTLLDKFIISALAIETKILELENKQQSEVLGPEDNKLLKNCKNLIEFYSDHAKLKKTAKFLRIQLKICSPLGLFTSGCILSLVAYKYFRKGTVQFLFRIFRTQNS